MTLQRAIVASAYTKSHQRPDLKQLAAPDRKGLRPFRATVLQEMALGALLFIVVLQLAGFLKIANSALHRGWGAHRALRGDDAQAYYQSNIDRYLSQPRGQPRSGPYNFSQLDVDYARLVADHVTEGDMAELRKMVGSQHSCEAISMRLGEEEFHPSMLVRNRTVRPWPGSVPKALSRWDAGKFSWQQWNATPDWIREPGVCTHW